MARLLKSKAIERLKKVLDAIPELKQLSYDSPKFEKWQRDTRLALTNTFEDANHISDFDRIDYFGSVWDPSTPDSLVQEDYVGGLDSAEALLQSMIDEIKEYWEDEKQTTSSGTRGEKQQDGEQTLKSSSAQGKDPPSSNKVFVIHGRDEGTKDTIARFLAKLGLEPVILHEQANEGRTIIEKFEEHAQVGFAIALLTPDDAGSLQGNENNLKPRARQNVVFEFGYFIGKLGRRRVCALVKGNVEKPSDYDGVLYIPLDDSDGWKMRLIKELKSAGFEVDANKAISA